MYCYTLTLPPGITFTSWLTCCCYHYPHPTRSYPCLPSSYHIMTTLLWIIVANPPPLSTTLPPPIGPYIQFHHPNTIHSSIHTNLYLLWMLYKRTSIYHKIHNLLTLIIPKTSINSIKIQIFKNVIFSNYILDINSLEKKL